MDCIMLQIMLDDSYYNYACNNAAKKFSNPPSSYKTNAIFIIN